MGELNRCASFGRRGKARAAEAIAEDSSSNLAILPSLHLCLGQLVVFAIELREFFGDRAQIGGVF